MQKHQANFCFFSSGKSTFNKICSSALFCRQPNHCTSWVFQCGLFCLIGFYSSEFVWGELLQMLQEIRERKEKKLWLGKKILVKYQDLPFCGFFYHLRTWCLDASCVLYQIEIEKSLSALHLHSFSLEEKKKLIQSISVSLKFQVLCKPEVKRVS